MNDQYLNVQGLSELWDKAKEKIAGAIPQPGVNYELLDEYDTEDGWHVRKWPDGYIEMSFIDANWIPGTARPTGDNSQLYYTTYRSVNFPVVLSKKYFEIGSINSTTGISVLTSRSIDGNNSKTSTFVAQCAISDYATKAMVVRIFVTGRWKEGSVEIGCPQNDIYSTEETRIGTWIDGRPIYRKVYLGTTTSESVTIEASSVFSPDIDIFVDLYVMLHGNQAKGMWVKSGWYYSDSNYFQIQIQNGLLTVNHKGTWYDNRPFYVVGVYTKTTDSVDTQMFTPLSETEVTPIDPNREDLE